VILLSTAQRWNDEDTAAAFHLLDSNDTPPTELIKINIGPKNRKSCREKYI
jgi:hypothetical protein